MIKRLERPSPAMIVAVIALIAALSGVAVAGGVFNKKKANKLITKRAPGLSVAHAKTAESATNASNATNATNAGNAAGATTAAAPAYWAHVDSAGTVLDGNGVDTANVTKSGAYYCFSGLSFTPRGLVASPDYSNGSLHFSTMLQVALAASGGLAGTPCLADTQAFVMGVDATTGVRESVAFYVHFFR